MLFQRPLDRSLNEGRERSNVDFCGRSFLGRRRTKVLRQGKRVQEMGFKRQPGFGIYSKHVRSSWIFKTWGETESDFCSDFKSFTLATIQGTNYVAMVVGMGAETE